MARSRDLFDDTTMTFGEHLEVLRVHVFRAVLGIVIAVSITLFFGDKIFYWLRTPVENAQLVLLAHGRSTTGPAQVIRVDARPTPAP